MDCSRRFIFLKEQDDRLLKLAGLETKWPAAALIGDVTTAVYQIQPVRHPAVGVAHAVIELIHQQGHADFQQIATSLCHAHALTLVPRLRNANADVVVGGQPPTIRGVGLTDIDSDKLDAVTITSLHLFQGPELGPEWPSGEAAESQHHRL
jgi:hypothetical protein